MQMNKCKCRSFSVGILYYPHGKHMVHLILELGIRPSFLFDHFLSLRAASLLHHSKAAIVANISHHVRPSTPESVIIFNLVSK